MQILSITNCPLDPKLGSGKTVLLFSQGLRQLGHQVEVLAPRDYEALPKVAKATKFRQAWGAWQVVQYKLKHSHYDLVEFYGDEFWLVSSRLARQPQRPFLVAHTNGLELLARQREAVFNPPQTLQTHLHHWFASQTHARFSKIAFANADAFVSLSQLDSQHVLQLGLYPPERVGVVPPGIDRDYLAMPFQAVREERIAFTGTWIARKGIDKLSIVMNKLLSSRPNLYFDIYGASNSQPKIRAAFAEQLQSRITVYPSLSNAEMGMGLTKAKIFFFPSQYEGFGIALAEAMACGCAVVTTPTGFGAELCHKQEAMIHDFEDTSAMLHSLNQLLDNESLRLNLAYAGWQRVQNLQWAISSQQLEKIYSGWLTTQTATKPIALIS